MRASNLAYALAVAFVASCSPSNNSFDAGTDGSRPDTNVSDTMAPDHASADATTDTRVDDVIDASTPDTSVPDATVDGADGSTGDAGAETADATDAPVTCEYIDSPTTLAYCTGTWTPLSEWVNTAGPNPACPPYYTSGSTRAPTVAELITALGCGDACVYRAESAVSFLHCGHRDEYTSYRSDTAGCDPIMMFSNGTVYPSIDDYNAANPCP